MGLFGRKTKTKNSVSFGEDVGIDDFPSATEDEKAPPIANNNSLTSSSSSSRVEQGERGEQQNHREITSSDDIMLPFPEPKAMSVCSDIEESNHQDPHKNIVGDAYAGRKNSNDEADYMYESDDIDEEIEFMNDVTSDANKEDFNYTTPKLISANGNNRNTSDNHNKMNSSTGKYVMPTIPDLNEEEISKSGRIDNRKVAQVETNISAVVKGRDDSNSNSNCNSNSTQKAQGNVGSTGASSISSKENNHNTSQFYQGSAPSGSNGSVREQQVQQQQKQNPQQNQIQYHSQQAQQFQHDLQSEKTRDLVKIFIGEIWNRGEIESIKRVCSPRLRFNGHTGLERVGHDGFSRMVTTVRSSLEGYHCEIHSMVVEGRKCFCRLKFTGKHVGELMGYPPTHKLVAWMGASEFTICPRRNQILKVWELGDIKTLEAQLMG